MSDVRSTSSDDAREDRTVPALAALATQQADQAGQFTEAGAAVTMGSEGRGECA